MTSQTDRADIIEKNFIQSVSQLKFPQAKSHVALSEVKLTHDDILDLFDSQLTSRHLDLHAKHLKLRNQSYYTIGSCGHEANAAVAKAFRKDDMAFLHYRSGAFMVQRLKYDASIDVEYDLLLSYVASSEDPIAAGRHKVFGSSSLNVPPQTSTIASHIPKSVGAAFGITAAKDAAFEPTLAQDSVVLCSLGDASVNHSSAQGAFNSAQWIVNHGYPLPIVFICEDNHFGISVPTPKDWIKNTMQDRIGIHYIEADGLNILDVYRAAKQAEHIARVNHQPVFLHLDCVRLLGHAGSDIESQYISEKSIEENESNDPLLHTARILVENKILTSPQIIDLYKAKAANISKKAKRAVTRPKLNSAEEVMSSVVSTKRVVKKYPIPKKAVRKKVFGDTYKQLSKKRTLQQHINYALTDILLQYPNTVVFGEDVAHKGGVYRVTADLMQCFGQKRVFDTLLDETTILGTAIGMAHNGFIPIPEIQYLAYLHNAEDQLRGEASSLSFFSNGQFTNPMVIRIASFAYQKGFGGHFHNDNSIAVLRDIPGIVVAAPSNGPDSAKMLRACVRMAHEQGRVVVFLEPIALYMTKDLHSKGDNEWMFEYPKLDQEIGLGEIHVEGEGDEMVIISYANGYYLSRQATKVIEEQYGIKVKLIDLRWLVPLPQEALLEEVKNAQNVLIVDECRKSASISEALFTLLMENLSELPKLKRITGEDCFIPLGDAAQYVLPGKQDIIAAVEDMLELNV